MIEMVTGEQVRDQRIERVEPLVPPAVLLDELPLVDEVAQVVLRGRAETHAILDGEDDRLLVVVGPCSVHDVEATLEYAERLAEQAARLRDDVLIAMRVYFEKPRTTTGWKGLINDPHLNGSGDVNAGLRLARGLLLKVLELGLPVGCEFLDELPLTDAHAAVVLRGREQVHAILDGEDDRLLVVVGPCSVHDVEATSVGQRKRSCNRHDANCGTWIWPLWAWPVGSGKSKVTFVSLST